MIARDADFRRWIEIATFFREFEGEDCYHYRKALELILFHLGDRRLDPEDFIG